MDVIFLRDNRTMTLIFRGSLSSSKIHINNNSDLTFEFGTPDKFVTPSNTTRMNEKQFKGLVYTGKNKAQGKKRHYRTTKP